MAKHFTSFAFDLFMQYYSILSTKFVNTVCTETLQYHNPSFLKQGACYDEIEITELYFRNNTQTHSTVIVEFKEQCKEVTRQVQDTRIKIIVH